MKPFLLFIFFILSLTFVIKAQPGAIDPTFNSAYIGNLAGADSTVYTTTIQNNGQLIIGGEFTSYNGISSNRIARLNSDGSLDPTFNIGTGANNTVFATAHQSDGKIIIAGNFTSFNGTQINRMARINTNGSLDTTFNVGTGAKHCIYATAIQNDGKIIFVGDFDTVCGTARYRLVRMNTDGSIDLSFDPGLGGTCTVFAISIQNDGKIIIGGAFVNYNSTPINRIARLNSDGSLDTTFDPGNGANNNVYTTSIQSDGGIIIGGLFTNCNGIPINHIARLDPNGSVDPTFNIGTATNNIVFCSSIQNDGRIIIGGSFTNYNGTAVNSLARLNTNGNIDASFNTGNGPNNRIFSTATQTDGKIIVGGSFTSYDGIITNRITRIFYSAEVLTTMKENNFPADFILYPTPNSGDFFIQAKKEANFSIINESGQLVKTFCLNANNNFTMSFTDLNSGIYFIYGLNANKFSKQKFVITK